MEPHRPGLQTEDEIQGFLHEGAKLHKDLIEINKTLIKITKIIETKEMPSS